PDFRTCTMPLITRRSSTRALPRVSVGRCGLIFENCASVSQNWSRLIYASCSEAVNHATTLVQTLLWVQTLGPRVGLPLVCRSGKAQVHRDLPRGAPSQHGSPGR